MSAAVQGTPAAATGASITLPTHAAGDLILICAYRDGSTVVPTKPAAAGTVPAWVTIDGPAGANTNAMIVCQFVATASNHTSGTWTGATGMAVIVFRGADGTTPIGGHAQGGTANSTGVVDLNSGAVTLSKTDGTSVIVRFVGARTVTAWGAAPSGWTSQANVATETEILTKNSTTSEDSAGDNQTNTFSANGGFRVQGVEVLAAAATAKSSTDTGSGTEALTETAAESQTETGSGAEALSQTASEVAADTGAGGETVTSAVPTAAADSGAGADTEALAAALPGGDAGVGSDAQALAAAAALNDTAAAADPAALTAQLALADPAGDLDLADVRVYLNAGDTGGGADQATVSTPGTAVDVTDDGHGLEQLLVAHAAADTATGNDQGRRRAHGISTGGGRLARPDRPRVGAARW